MLAAHCQRCQGEVERLRSVFDAARDAGAPDREGLIGRLRDRCEAGDALHCTVLGRALFVGWGIARDEAGAQVAFEQACSAGSTEACGRLGH